VVQYTGKGRAPKDICVHLCSSVVTPNDVDSSVARSDTPIRVLLFYGGEWTRGDGEEG